MNMVHIWRGIQHPKIDFTSFGHWSGTGLVEWHKPGALRAEVERAAKSAMSDPGAVAEPAAASDPAVTRPAAVPVSTVEPKRILLLCHQKPNYIPDLLLHGLRKLLGPAVVDYPRKDALYDGILGQPYLDRIDGLMAADAEVDRSEITAKIAAGYFDLVLCDIRAINTNRELLQSSRSPVALIDGEDRAARIKPGNYVILRRETDGNDFSVPLPMAMPVELLDCIDRHADTPKTHDIGFLGSRSSLTVERNAILDELSRICPDALIGAWSVAAGKWRGRDAYYNALQSCKMVLTLPGAGFDTFRYWENAACNAGHVASRMKLFIPHDFRDGREIVRFSDSGELAATMERIAGGSTDWRALAEQSRQWLRRFHTTEHRAVMILDRLKAAFLR